MDYDDQMIYAYRMLKGSSQLLDFFGHEDLGKRILDTMEVMLTEHRDKLTPDQGGNAKTSECGDAFVELLRNGPRTETE